MADAPARKRIPWLRWAGTLLSVGLLVYLVAQSWQDLVDSFRSISWGIFALAVLLTIISRFSVSGRWLVLLRSAEVKISWGDSIRLTFAGLFAANFLPTTVGGDLVRFAGAVRLGFDAGISAASLIVDRLVGMAGMVTVLPIGLASFLANPLPLKNPLPTSMLAVSSGGLAARVWAWVIKALQNVWKAVRLWATHPRALLFSYLFTWGHMFVLFLSVWIFLQAMGESISFWLVMGLWSMGYFVTLLPISVNGLGVQEVAIAFFFHNYGGISIHSVLALAILMRALYIVASLPGALFVPALLQPEKKPSPPQELP